MKQNVNAPIAAIIIVVAIIVSVGLFRGSRGMLPEEKTLVLPYEPPVEDSEVNALRQGLAPLGIGCVWPPLANDRFRGARVALVAATGPAGRAGMKAGDLIVKINGLTITSPMTVAAALQRADRKKPSAVVVVRAGKEQVLSVSGLMLPPMAAITR